MKVSNIMNTLELEYEILDSLEDIETVTVEAEMDVVLTLSSLYGKQAMIMEYASSEDVAEEIIQEGAIWDQATGKGKKENIIKKILLFIPRLIKAFFLKIKSAFSRSKESSRKDKEVQQQVQQVAEKAGLNQVAHEGGVKPITDDQANKIIDAVKDNKEQIKPTIVQQKTINPKLVKQPAPTVNRDKENARILKEASKYIDLTTGKMKYFDLDQVYALVNQAADFYNKSQVLHNDFKSVQEVESVVDSLLKHEFINSSKFGPFVAKKKSLHGLQGNAIYKISEITDAGYKFYDYDEFNAKSAKIVKLIKSIDIWKTLDRVEEMKVLKVPDISKISSKLTKLYAQLSEVMGLLISFGGLRKRYEMTKKEYEKVLAVYQQTVLDRVETNKKLDKLSGDYLLKKLGEDNGKTYNSFDDFMNDPDSVLKL